VVAISTVIIYALDICIILVKGSFVFVR